MAAPRPDITWIGSPNYRVLNGIPKLGVCIHWMVGNLAGTDQAFARESYGVATNWGIENEVIHQYVDSKDYAFGTGDTWANTYLESIEHAGGWVLPDGSRMKPTPETHESSARLIAWRADQWGWGTLERGVNVFDHNDFIATECPGTTDIDWIVARANAIRSAGDFGSTTKGQDVGLRVEIDNSGAGYTKGQRFIVDRIDAEPRLASSIDWNLAGFFGYPTISTSGASWATYKAALLPPSAVTPGGTVNLKPILDAIAAGEEQDAKDREAVLAAIAGAPAATLAAFGLKRA